MTLQFRLPHKHNKQESRILNLKLFHLALVQSHFAVSEHQHILDQVSCTTQQPRFEKEWTRSKVGVQLRSSPLQCKTTMIGQADQEKTLWLLLTENFYRGYLLRNGQKYQQQELSFQRIPVKIQVELGLIHRYKELKRLNRPPWLQLHQM